jgi:hypothetical protein
MKSKGAAPTESKLSAEDRLSGVLFQFIQLYEQLSADRQALDAQAAKLKVVLSEMSAAAKAVSEFKPQVSQAVEESWRGATHRMTQVVLNAAGDLKDRTEWLNTALSQAESLLKRYEVQTTWSDWKHWITIALTAMVGGTLVGLLVARLMMPTVSLPLSVYEAQALQQGETFNVVWPMLSPAEQKHYEQLAKKAGAQKPR